MISIIVPCYNEESTIETFYNAITAEMERLKEDFEVVFINDGSSDKTKDIATELCNKDKRIKLINFSRNFGQQAAIIAGLRNCVGDCALELDVDLQDPVEVIQEMLKLWREGYQVVHGRRKKREGESAFKRASAYMYYKFLAKINEREIPRNTGDFKLYDRQVINEICALPEHEKYLRGLAAWVGFKQTFVDFDRKERTAGQTHYTMKKMVKLAKAGIISNSYYPLSISIKAGIFNTIASLLCFITFIVLACCKITLPLTAWLFPTIALVAGLTFIFIGLSNLYIEKIYTETKNRPEYIIAETINISSKEEK